MEKFTTVREEDYKKLEKRIKELENEVALNNSEIKIGDRVLVTGGYDYSPRRQAGGVDRPLEVYTVLNMTGGKREAYIQSTEDGIIANWVPMFHLTKTVLSDMPGFRHVVEELRTALEVNKELVKQLEKLEKENESLNVMLWIDSAPNDLIPVSALNVGDWAYVRPWAFGDMNLRNRPWSISLDRLENVEFFRRHLNISGPLGTACVKVEKIGPTLYAVDIDAITHGCNDHE